VPHAAALKRRQKVGRVFELPTQATSAKALGGEGLGSCGQAVFESLHYRMRMEEVCKPVGCKDLAG